MINTLTLVGRLTKDPELKYTPNGNANCTFTLAVNRSFTSQQGEREADYINCVVWKKSAESLASYQKKGNLIGLVGRIQTRNYENQEGKRIFITEVVAESVQFLEPKSKNESGSNQGNTDNSRDYQNNRSEQQRSNNNYTKIDDDPFSGKGSDPGFDPNDLPF